jgi:dihydroxyacetone kinase-like predicted kinase
VDAGGYALTIIFAGVVAALRGEDPPELDHHAPARITHPQHESSTFRFCTNFAVTGSGLKAGRFIAPLERLGDSVLVVGDETTLKVHIHTDDPELAVRVFAAAGEVSRLDVADMRAQLADREQRLAGGGAGDRRDGGGADGDTGGGGRGGEGAARSRRLRGPASGRNGAAPPRCAAIAVAGGEGLHALFHELGVHTIDGGPTLNPSTYDLLAAIHEIPAEEVVLLPNSPNVIMAAEHAARLSDKQVLVARTTSQQAGLAAAVALVPERSVEENARALAEALARVRTGAVAPAARDDAQGRFKAGDAVGFLGEEVLAWGEPADTLAAVLTGLAGATDGSPPPELISVIEGDQAPIALGELEELLDAGEGAELELRHGGQSAYWWLLAAE